MRTVFSILLMAKVLFLGTTLGAAQDSPEIPVIGYLAAGSITTPGGQSTRAEFLQGLEEIGYVDGRNIRIEYRSAKGRLKNLPELAADLVRRKVSLIVAFGATTVGYAIKATNSIPIIMVGSGDPVGRGYVKSLSAPGGNVTGLSSFVEGEDAKRMELFKETIPLMSRIAVLNSRPLPGSVETYKDAGKRLGIDVQAVNFENLEGIDKALSSIAAMGPDGLITVPHTYTIGNMELIAKFALDKHFPSLFPRKQYVKAGGLMAYDIDRAKMSRRAAVYVDRILKGADPATIPVEPPKFELIINLKTAEKIGVTIPPEILLEATEVIK